MDSDIWVARNLAAAFLSSDWTAGAMEEAGRAALGAKSTPKWLGKLVSEVRETAAQPYPPAPRSLARLIIGTTAFRRLRAYRRKRPLIERAVTTPAKFAPTPAFRDLEMPQLATLRALSDWLNLPARQLDWLADVEGYRASAATEAARHYDYKWVPKSGGSPRLIEAPKSLTKGLQRQILRGILDLVPVHDCAHGYCKRRSCLTSAQLHAGERLVVSMDLRDFFLNVPLHGVHGLFRCLGFPWSVARCLTGLCSTATPADVFARLPATRRPDWQTRKRFRQPHLPQGAPTSPALANLCAWRLDRRLEGLAKGLGARYTRYGDDLAFSGDRDFARRIDRFPASVAAICAEAGFPVNARKTRIMRQGVRQYLTGLVVNQHVNVSRQRYDRLKAVLHNCARHGPADQNRTRHPDFRAHLDGQITWVENVNPRRGHRLRLLYQDIDWG